MAQERRWVRLDNAAKLFPSTRSKRDTRVFRFSCELVEDVDSAVLQHALNKTISRFPLYRSVLKKGLFWYYLEESALNPVVREEYKPPLTQLYDGNSRNLLFEVTYYRKRINIEVFHVLSDGAGTEQFFKVLLTNYLVEKYEPELDYLINEVDTGASAEQRRVDSFSTYYDKNVAPVKEKKAFAYQIKGEKHSMRSLRVIEGMIPVSGLKAKAKESSATITEFLVANLIASIGDTMETRRKNRPVIISVPVNLRQFFPSATARNFFGVIYVIHSFKNDGEDFASIVETVKTCFREELTEEKMRARINSYQALENMMIAKVVPLMLKNPIVRLGNWGEKKLVTAALSNVGRITLPKPLEKYVYLMDVFDSTEKLQAVITSFGDRLVTGFTSAFISTDIEMSFFRRLSALGLEVTITGSTEE